MLDVYVVDFKGLPVVTFEYYLTQERGSGGENEFVLSG